MPSKKLSKSGSNPDAGKPQVPAGNAAETLFSAHHSRQARNRIKASQSLAKFDLRPFEFALRHKLMRYPAANRRPNPNRGLTPIQREGLVITFRGGYDPKPER